jgi:hypothetical protein
VRHRAVFIAAALIFLTASLVAYRVVYLGYPLLPTAPGETWHFAADLRVQQAEGPLSIALGLPTEHDGRMVVEERVSSGSLGFSLAQRDLNRVGLWSGQAGPGEGVITYRATILVRPGRTPRARPPAVDPYPAALRGVEKGLVERIAARFNSLIPPARLQRLSEAVAGDWGSPPLSGEDLKSWEAMGERLGESTQLLALLRAAKLPARPAEGIFLGEGVTGRPMNWIEVWTGQKWENVNSETGEVYGSDISLLPLAIGGFRAVEVTGGHVTDLRWAVNREVVSQWRLYFERMRRSQRFLDRWSLFRLPEEFQRTFRILLLVPLGALLICVLRNIIGFPTFGIFMPVLMALAFRSTGLTYGLTIFAGVLLFGYGVRRIVDRLHLLLVPRMSVLLTVVIACFTVLALAGNRLGIREVMAVGLLPFVILAMTIERFFVVVEEVGVREAMVTSAGSAAVAVITYGIISWEPLQLTFFVYPELMAAVAAVQLLIGRYTGYRLSEFIRFRSFKGDHHV